MHSTDYLYRLDELAAEIRATGLFDAAYYLETNLDVAASGMDPLIHYIRYGHDEGRRPRAVMPAGAGIHPLFHLRPPRHSRPDGKRVVLVLGMHRSGTSCLARMLHIAGVALGGPLLLEGRPDNPDGYWEHEEVIHTQDLLLKNLDRVLNSSNGMLQLPGEWHLWPETAVARGRLSALVGHEMDDKTVWAVKDPRLMRFLPLWWEVLGDLRFPVQTILCLRNPDEVAASMSVRDSYPRAWAHRLWRQSHIDMVRDLPKGPDVTVCYDDLMTDPTATLQRVSDKLSLGIGPEALAEAAASVREERRHHRLPIPEDPEGAEAGALYHLLRRGGEEGGLPAMPATPRGAAPKVSIVMRTRDRPLFLPRAVRSVLAQTHGNWELLVANHGSRGTVETALAPYRAALGDRLVLIDGPPEGGMEAVSNAALARASGDYVVIHDDDDTWLPRFLEAAIAHLDRNGGEGVVCRTLLAWERVEGDAILPEREELFRPELSGVHLQDLLRGNLFPPISFLFRRRALDEVGRFRTDYLSHGDYEFNIRFLRRHRIGFLDEILARWHLRDPQKQYPNWHRVIPGNWDRELRDNLLREAKSPADAAIAILPAVAMLIDDRLNDLAARLERSLTPPPAGRNPAPAISRGDVRHPDFLVIGAQRSGTTWLYRNLSRHPDIWLPPLKEIHYFDQLHGPDRVLGPRMRLRHIEQGAGGQELRSWLKWASLLADSDQPDDDWYRQIFAAAQARQSAGEITPAYAVLPDEGVAHIRRLMPEARILFLMRHPVERMISGAIHQLTVAADRREIPSLDAILTEMATEHCRGRSGYRKTIETWERHFPREQMAYLFFDDIRNDPAAVLKSVCRHLGREWSGEIFPEKINANIDLPEETTRLAWEAGWPYCRDELSWLAERFPGAAPAAWGTQ